MQSEANRRRFYSYLEGLLIVALAAVGWKVASHYDAFEHLVAFLETAEKYELDELVLALLFVGYAGIIFAVRRHSQLVAETKRRTEAEVRSAWMAKHDVLTGLPNRQYLIDIVENHTIGIDAKGCAILALDLDGFKAVNDLVGHHGGDELLQIVAKRLQQTCPVDTVIRVGGDEFVIFLTGKHVAMAKEIARRVINVVREPITISGILVEVGTSVGIAKFPEQANCLDTTHQCADIALYKAKNTAKGTAVTFDNKLGAAQTARANMEQALRQAIRNDEITLQYQPYLNINTGEILGFEALARWRMESGELVSPGKFIGIAEQSGQILELSDQLFKHACDAAKNWPENIKLSFNMSAAQLCDKLMGQRLLDIIAAAGISANRVEIEVTESCFVENLDVALISLKDLREAGVRLALDDFGSGYSSLTRLTQLDIDTIKIDKKFIYDCLKDDKMKSVVSSIVHMCKDLNTNVVAKGVENAEQYNEMKKLGCDMGQGFLFGPPMNDTQVVKLLATDENLLKQIA